MTIDWVDGSVIRVSIDNGEAVISANKEGLLSLAQQLTTLAEETAGNVMNSVIRSMNSRTVSDRI